ncbi:MAG: hypothetical protein AABZ47_12860 [Planctomycetota bacterium]
MIALTSVWMGLGTLLVALAMLVHRPAMTDTTLVLVLYFGSPGSICLAGLVLWAYRKESDMEPGIVAQKQQARVAICISLLAAIVVYALIFGSKKIDPTTNARKESTGIDAPIGSDTDTLFAQTTAGGAMCRPGHRCHLLDTLPDRPMVDARQIGFGNPPAIWIGPLRRANAVGNSVSYLRNDDRVRPCGQRAVAVGASCSTGRFLDRLPCGARVRIGL